MQAIDPAILTRNAHVALSLARGRGHDQVVTFVPSMQAALDATVELESDLRQAVVGHQFVLQ